MDGGNTKMKANNGYIKPFSLYAQMQKAAKFTRKSRIKAIHSGRTKTASHLEEAAHHLAKAILESYEEEAV